MRKLRIALLILVLAVAGVMALRLLDSASRKAACDNTSTRYWVAQLPLTLVSTQGVFHATSATMLGQQYGGTGNVSVAMAALQGFGTNAIPYLLQILRGEDTTIEQKATQLAIEVGARRVPFRNAQCERAQAVTALIRLNELPPDTMQTLARMSTNAPPETALAASFILRARDGKVPLPGW